MAWEPSNNLLAQITHLFIASTITFGFPYLCGVSPWWTGPMVLGWIVVKEFGFDLVVEQAGVESGIYDASFYILGWAVSIGLCAATGKV